MPVISRFNGLVISMFYNDHEPPHMHVLMGDVRCVMDIETTQLSRGKLPSSSLRNLIKWCTITRRELLINWERAKRHEALHDIPPLS